jgi:hypothetical protein
MQLRPTQTVQIKRIGDVYQGYTVTNITADSMVLELGSRREVIPLHEGTKQASMGKTPIIDTQVVSIGGSSSGGISGRGGATIMVQGPNGQTIAVRSSANTPGGRNSGGMMGGMSGRGGGRGGMSGGMPTSSGISQIIQQISGSGSTDPTAIMRTLFGTQTSPGGTTSQGGTSTPFGNINRPAN